MGKWRYSFTVEVDVHSDDVPESRSADHVSKRLEEALKPNVGFTRAFLRADVVSGVRLNGWPEPVGSPAGGQGE